MDYENLWELNDESEFLNLELTEAVVGIMKQQCDYLKKSTNGMVFAKFAKIKYISPMLASGTALQSLGSVLSAVAPKEVVGDTENMNLMDANSLYNEARYGFEIYNKNYKFRAFEMHMDPVYPIQIIIDEGINQFIKDQMILISEGTDQGNKYNIRSEKDLLECLRLIFSCKKVRFIVYRMKEISEKMQTEN